ncbi:hypothetical protein WJX77_010414 [Trebouxia sp. C0004]
MRPQRPRPLHRSTRWQQLLQLQVQHWQQAKVQSPTLWAAMQASLGVAKTEHGVLCNNWLDPTARRLALHQQAMNHSDMCMASQRMMMMKTTSSA